MEPPPGTVSQRQKRMGPAPFASFEDLSDELESPDDKNLTGSVVRLPGIREDPTTPTPTTPSKISRSVSPAFPSGISLIGAVANTTYVPPMSSPLPPPPKSTIKPPSTPRIDISRASSSSHHDSRDSTPDREIFDGHDPNSAKLGLGFREDGALDLRSSTEELDFHDVKDKRKEKGRAQSPSPVQTDEFYHVEQRKDSQCSDIVLLSISGRTSRLSSIGSQSSAQSRLSNTSHLSVMSGQSGLSRCSSPHKTLLETSFCGTKSPENSESVVEVSGTKPEAEELEKMLLSRKHDPTQAILAEGIKVETKHKQRPEKPARKTETLVHVKSDIKINVHTPELTDCNNSEAPKLPRKIVSKSGVEYIYIPLKGPLPPSDEPDPPEKKLSCTVSRQRHSDVKSANTRSRNQIKDAKHKSKSLTTSPAARKKEKGSLAICKLDQPPAAPKIERSPQTSKTEEPKYIRIKLKPDHCYQDQSNNVTANSDIQKPETLDLKSFKHQQDVSEITIEQEESFIKKCDQTQSLSNTPNISPKFTRHKVESSVGSVSPSPSVSRRSSFASLFKSKEAIMSPESPTVPGHKRKNTLTGILRETSESLRDRSRSRSKSRDRDKTSLSAAPSSTESIDSKSKHRSVLSIFKTSKKDKKSDHESSSQETLPRIDGIGKVEFKFNDTGKSIPIQKHNKHYERPLDGESIRIPLHSPTYYEDRSILQDWKTSSQDSQETVIEVSTRKSVNAVVEPVPQNKGNESLIITKEINNYSKVNLVKSQSSRQSSTSSENVVFTTNLGCDNEIFTTKLPKQKTLVRQTGAVHTNGVEPSLETTKAPLNRPKEKQEKREECCKNVINESVNERECDGTVKDPECDKIVKPVREPDRGENVKESEKNNSSQNIKTQKLNSSNSAQELEEKKAAVTEPLEAKKTAVTEPLEAKKSAVTEHKVSQKRISQISQISNRSSLMSSTADDERNNSSESERDSELEYSSKGKKEIDLKLDLGVVEPERKAIVFQQDSYEDELPYVPTTLPQERSAAVPIVPIKQRSTFEMKTCPIDRPRSTTPINPSCLEEYCEEVMGNFDVETVTKTIEKLKISLPRNDSFNKGSKLKSPRNTNWQEFAEKNITTTPRSSTGDTPPPLPPKGVQKSWINFEEIPEKRKAPKRIQTIPSMGHIEVPETVLQDNVVYNYVNPEECKCECHELNAKERDRRKQEPHHVQEDELPLLEDDVHDDEKSGDQEKTRLEVAISDCRSIVSDSSVDLSASVEPSDMHPNGVESSLRTPFTSDLGLSSNRSSIVSQEDLQSPESPNAFPKIS